MRCILPGLLAAGLLVQAGCSDVSSPGMDMSDPERVLVMGNIGTPVDPPYIEVPDTVTAGADFLIRFHTYGGGCHAKGFSEVELKGGVVVITPYDSTARPGTGCTRQLLTFEHTATARFTGGHGLAAVILRGRRTWTGDVVTTEIRQVWVRPAGISPQ